MTIEAGDGDVPPQGALASEDSTELAVAHLHAAALAFDVIRAEIASLLEEVRNGETDRSAKLKPMLMDLARSVTVLARAGELVNDERRRKGAAVSEQALDLASARSEVERRLAELRDA